MVAATVDMTRPFATIGQIALSTLHGRGRIRFFRGDPTPELLAELADLAERGCVRGVVDRVFPLDEIADAHRSLEAGGVLGKHVIRITEQPAAGQPA